MPAELARFGVPCGCQRILRTTGRRIRAVDEEHPGGDRPARTLHWRPYSVVWAPEASRWCDSDRGVHQGLCVISGGRRFHGPGDVRVVGTRVPNVSRMWQGRVVV